MHARPGQRAPTPLRFCSSSWLPKRKLLLGGKLGKAPSHKAKIELKGGAAPVHKKPYSVPLASQEAFKKELEELAKDGALERAGPPAQRRISVRRPRSSTAR